MTQNRKYNIKEYKNRDLLNEISRRLESGDLEMIKSIYVLPTEIKMHALNLSGGWRQGLKPGSKRSLFLKYGFSGKEIVDEVFRRIRLGDKKILSDFNFAIQTLDVNKMAKGLKNRL